MDSDSKEDNEDIAEDSDSEDSSNSEDDTDKSTRIIHPLDDGGYISIVLHDVSFHEGKLAKLQSPQHDLAPTLPFTCDQSTEL